MRTCVYRKSPGSNVQFYAPLPKRIQDQTFETLTGICIPRCSCPMILPLRTTLCFGSISQPGTDSNLRFKIKEHRMALNLSGKNERIESIVRNSSLTMPLMAESLLLPLSSCVCLYVSANLKRSTHSAIANLFPIQPLGPSIKVKIPLGNPFFLTLSSKSFHLSGLNSSASSPQI